MFYFKGRNNQGARLHHLYLVSLYLVARPWPPSFVNGADQLNRLRIYQKN